MALRAQNRSFLIEDDGDAYQVQLLQDGIQMGGAYFPDDGTGEAFQDAMELGESWVSGGAIRPPRPRRGRIAAHFAKVRRKP